MESKGKTVARENGVRYRFPHHLYNLRFLIDEFTRDFGRAPLHLKELVEKGYLGWLPTDPFTGSNETWQET